MKDVALSHWVKVGGVVTPATCLRLYEDGLRLALERWRADYETCKDSCPELLREAVHDWEWLAMARGALRRTYGLFIEGNPTPVGLVSTRFDKTKAGRSCVHVRLLTKAPKTFLPPVVTGVGRALVAEAVHLSQVFQSEGRVRIPDAVCITGTASSGNPSVLYRSLGFEGAPATGNGVEYEDLEITASNAERLIEEYRNGQ